MEQSKNTDVLTNNSQINLTGCIRYTVAATICAQNRTRAEFIPDLEFGDPIWDILLSLYTAEYHGKSTTASGLSERSGISTSTTDRCLKYLLDRGAIIENENQYSRNINPYTVSDETKDTIGAWLDNCVSSLQTGLDDTVTMLD